VKLFRIPIKIEPAFFVMTLFLGLGGSRRDPVLLLEWVVVVLVSIVVHELGHALVARAFGLMPQIRLYQMGGLTSWTSGKQLNPLRHLAISLAGPAFGFVFGGLVLLLGKSALDLQTPLVAVIYFDLLWVNIGWSIFNLLPILPMDGGQVLVTLESWLRKRDERLLSHTISLVAALAIAVIAFNARSLWIGFLGIYFAYLNGSYLFARWQAFRDRRLDKSFETARAAIERDEDDAALHVLSAVAPRAQSTQVKRYASHMTIVVYLKQEKIAQAETELRRHTALFGGDYYLQGALHFLKGEMAEALPNLKAALEQQPEKQIGIMLCKTLMGVKDFAAALFLCSHPALAEVRGGLLVELALEAFNHGDFETSAAAGIAAYDLKADPNVAYNAACAFARAAKHSEALVWTGKAIDAGFRDVETLRSDHDLDALRSLPEFAALLAQFDAART
jgi:Zn-dependent protease